MTQARSKKMFRKFVAQLLAVLMIVSSVLVYDAGTAAAATAKPAISKTAMNIFVGKTFDFNVKNQIANSTYKWSSSDKTIVTVDSKGVVKGKKQGDAVITCVVKAPKKTYKLTANVTIIKPALKIVINNKISTLNVGQKYNLNRTIYTSKSNDKTVWTSSDSSIAAPNSKGVFTAKKEGTVTITAKTLSGQKDKVTIKVVDAQGTAESQEELDELLGTGAEKITVVTGAAVTFNIKKGDYSKQTLTVNAPNADVKNNGTFKKINIVQIKANTWYEQAVGNNINVTAPTSRIIISENASAAISVGQGASNLTLVNNGTVSGLTLDTNASISIAGSSTQAIPLVANVANVTVTSSVPLNLTCNQRINLVLLPGAEATVIHVASSDLIPIITGSVNVTVIVGEGANASTVVVAPTASTDKNDSTTPSTPSTPTTPTTPTTPETPATVGTIAGRVTTLAVSGSAVSGGAVSGGAVSGGAVSGGALAGVNVRILKYADDITAALDSIFTNPNTVLAITDEYGYYSVNNLTPGNYVVVFGKSGYKVLAQLTSVTAGVSTTLNGALIELGEGESVAEGIASGRIINSLTGTTVDSSLEFTIKVYENFNSTQTLLKTVAVTGAAFTLSLPEGYYTLQISDNRTPVAGTTYATTFLNAVVLGGTTFADQNIVLSTLKEDGQATFVLSWGEFPYDLDSHLIGPVEGDDVYHIYYSDKTYPDVIAEGETYDLRLDLDDVTSYGPETTTIYHSVAGGIYTYYVHNYSGDDTLVNSNAKVVVTTSNGTYTFEVPTNGTDELSWVVCTYNSATGAITPINQLFDGNYYYDTYENSSEDSSEGELM